MDARPEDTRAVDNRAVISQKLDTRMTKRE